MDEFKEYLKFPDLETATEYTNVLNKNGIPFQLDDISIRFEIIPSRNISGTKFILKLRDEDLQKTNQVLASDIDESVKNLPLDHYLYTFSDGDIIDIIANQSEWTQIEIKLALEIAKVRGLNISALSLNSAKRKPEPKPPVMVNLNSTAHWFSIFGFFSILNSISLRLNFQLRLPGLTITSIIENAFVKIYGRPHIFGFIICLILASLFFIISKYGKHNKWVFATGIFLLFIDSLLLTTTGNWVFLIFNFFAIAALVNGLLNTKNKKNA